MAAPAFVRIEPNAPKEIKPIPTRDWQSEAGVYQNRHLVTIDPAIYPACLTDCRYISLVENKICCYDRIEFRARDNTFVADAIVAEVIQKSFVRMVEISKTILSETPTVWAPTAMGDWYSIFLGGNRHFAIVSPTGQIMRDGFLSKANADAEFQVRKRGAPINTLSGR